MHKRFQAMCDRRLTQSVHWLAEISNFSDGFGECALAIQKTVPNGYRRLHGQYSLKLNYSVEAWELQGVWMTTRMHRKHTRDRLMIKIGLWHFVPPWLWGLPVVALIVWVWL